MPRRRKTYHYSNPLGDLARSVRNTRDVVADGWALSADDDSRARAVTVVDTMIRDLRAVRRTLSGTVRTCEVCGVEFIGRADARYHDDACRQRAHRARNG